VTMPPCRYIFEAPEVRLKIDKAAIDEAYKEITGSLSEQESRRPGQEGRQDGGAGQESGAQSEPWLSISLIISSGRLSPMDFKAQVVVFDRECCVLYKKANG